LLTGMGRRRLVLMSSSVRPRGPSFDDSMLWPNIIL